ncbi:MAG TPA: hypothetical protein VFH06_01405 [Candidatus Saccharimonadales bacterium]|nr:hypothetical protein [Candidatus Saccharimonadales bacterium]
MKVSRLEQVSIITLLVIFLGIVFHAPLSVGISQLLPGYDLLIKSWKEILMVLLIPAACIVVTKRHMWNELARDWIFRLIVVYGVLHIILVGLLWRGTASTLAGLAIDLRYVLFFGLVYVFVRAVPSSRRSLIMAASIGAAVVVGFATLQLFLPPDILTHIGYSKDTIAPYLTVDKNPNYIRVNSTLRGPNPLGAYAGMVLGFLTALLAKGRLQLKRRSTLITSVVFGICSVVALWISYSRSALVASIVTVLSVVLIATFTRISKRAWVAAGAIIIVLAGGLIAARNTNFVSNVILHENPDGGSSISSNDGHIESLQYGTGQLVKQPLGGGIGSTGSASLLSEKPLIVENQYLFIGHEVGWIGLGLFVALFVVIMKRLWRYRADWLALGAFASGIGLSIIGILLPVWADDTVSIIWWGIAAIAIVGGSHVKRTSN